MWIKYNIGRRGAGFTLLEILITISILMIMASVITLNANAFGPTAKSEAERIATIIHKAMQRSDRVHDGFTIQLGDTDGERELLIIWDSKGDQKRSYIDIFKVPQDFSLTSRYTGDNNLKYSAKSNTFITNGRTFMVTRKSDKSYYCVVCYRNGGRIRVCKEPPTDGAEEN